MKRIDSRSKIISAIREMYGDVETITRQELKDASEKFNFTFPQWMTKEVVSRGIYRIPKLEENTNNNEVVSMAPVSHTGQFIPDVSDSYVEFGYYKELDAIIDSKKFFPVYITGLSGNGKTAMPEQICAKRKREMIRANITSETDEDSLLGGFRLIRGKTVWEDGPVILAMKRGAILLLDEVDLGTNKLLCLQPVLEGKPIYVKRINQLVHPAPGFNVVATANTKGQGSETGKFIGTNTLNEAFLERFTVTFEQDYPPQKIEIQILKKLPSYTEDMEEFVNLLTHWSELVRKAYAEFAINEVISTRRLIHIINTYSVLRSKKKAIEMCLNRFDEEVQSALMDLYKKVDKALDEANNPRPAMEQAKEQANAFVDDLPF